MEPFSIITFLIFKSQSLEKKLFGTNINIHKCSQAIKISFKKKTVYPKKLLQQCVNAQRVTFCTMRHKTESQRDMLLVVKVFVNITIPAAFIKDRTHHFMRTTKSHEIYLTSNLLYAHIFIILYKLDEDIESSPLHCRALKRLHSR
jgi:hypothetical protein